MGWPRAIGFPGRVDPNEEPAADWRDEACYAPLRAADRSIFAWEWLRRDPGYREEASRALRRVRGPGGPAPGRWGLVRFESPDLAAPLARPIWRRDTHPPVLAVIATSTPDLTNAFSLARFASMATVVRSEGDEHLLLSDGLSTIRIDVVDGTLGAGPVELRYLLAGTAAAERPLLTLRRLLKLQQVGRFSRSLHPPEAKARRWALMLRAYDGLAAGAEQRELAAILLSRSAREPRWRTSSSSLRSQVQRLVRDARRMANSGYRQLLC